MILDQHMVGILGTVLLGMTVVDWLMLIAATTVVDLVLIGTMEVLLVVTVGYVTTMSDTVITIQD